MIINCLTGENPRIYTESYGVGIFHGVFSGIDKMFAEGKKTDPSFIQLAPERASKYLYKHRTGESKLDVNDRILCQWICNMTDKGFVNILEKKPEKLDSWITSVMKSIDIVGDFKEDNIINIAKYNASLAKKGGLKSAMGNLFETLFLYSALSVCGITFVPKKELEDNAHYPVFSLDATEESTKGRQTDAFIQTGLEKPTHICIDIGFIGMGNPEIIADKTQRFSNALGGGNKSLVSTIIIASAIPEKSGRLVEEQARRTGAKVVTMSGKNWISALSRSLKEFGIDDITVFPEDKEDARLLLGKNLPSSKDIVKLIPGTLESPSHW